MSRRNTPWAECERLRKRLRSGERLSYEENGTLVTYLTKAAEGFARLSEEDELWRKKNQMDEYPLQARDYDHPESLSDAELLSFQGELENILKRGLTLSTKLRVSGLNLEYKKQMYVRLQNKLSETASIVEKTERLRNENK